MTTEENDTGPDVAKLNTNLAKIEELSQRLLQAFGKSEPIDPSLQGPGHDLYLKAANAYMAEMMANPTRLIESQVAYWGKSLQHFIDSKDMLSAGTEIAADKDRPKDKRFSNPMWDTHPYFKFIMQQYLINSEAVSEAISSIEGMDARDKKRLEYFSGQIMNMLSPTNYLGTNPDALMKAVETDGQSLVDGLENLVRDLERNEGQLLVTLADETAFEVGKNIATTPGSVVYRNRMMELIQYAPSTEKVYTKPLIIFPPWINKFYILDLKQQNSLIKWIVDQGYTLFVVSWVNPDSSYADVGMDTYIDEGYLTAIEEVKKITGQKSVNAVGYCIAGTALSLTLALLAKRGDRSVNSATFFTTMTDFSDQGEFGVFLDDDFVDGIAKEAEEHGVLRSFYMSRTFSYLRSNDLIYTPAIRSYMMGEAPPAFDLLFWNGDSTNLPARMTVEYLRWLCQDNQLAKGEFTIHGETLSLADVKVPLCAVACETDHIAAWDASYNGVKQMGSKDKTFILSQSGHIAGIVNPPSKNKYGHYTNPDLSLTSEDWRHEADLHEGSWWPRWDKWLSKRSGAKIAARSVGDSQHPELAPAPGTYVKAVPSD